MECFDIPQSDLIEFLNWVFTSDSKDLVISDNSKPYKSFGTRILLAIVEIVPGCTHLIPEDINEDVVAHRSAIRE